MSSETKQQAGRRSGGYIIKLAWRNLWRNKRRTMITVASVMLAVILSTMMRSMQLGSYAKMIENVVGFFTGYLQIQSAEFDAEPSLDNGFVMNDTVMDILRQNTAITAFAPRQETYVWLSSDSLSRGAMLIGTDPDLEDSVTNLSGKVTEGRYFDKDEASFLVAGGLAEKLGVSPGDTLVVMGQGYHGAQAVGMYPVCGLISFGAPDLNKSMIYLPLSTMQQLTGGEVITSVALMLDNNGSLLQIDSLLQHRLGTRYKVKTWIEMMPEMEQTIQADNAGGLIMAGILYFIIAFGIFGTLLMMLSERMREFGMLISLGMKQIQLGAIVLTESVMIGILATIAGMAMSIPMVIWFLYHPIRFTGEVAEGYEAYGFEPAMFVSTDPSIFLMQGLIVLIIMLILALFPFFRILKINPITAMRP